MSKYYKFPCLLIEFSPDKMFALQVFDTEIYLLLSYVMMYLVP